MAVINVQLEKILTILAFKIIQTKVKTTHTVSHYHHNRYYFYTAIVMSQLSITYSVNNDMYLSITVVLTVCLPLSEVCG